jgi:predicted DNA-binding transcriptional regulator AlpA
MQLNTNNLITLPQLVKLCKVSRQTVYNWIENGTAPRYERIGGRYFFYRDDSEAKRKGLGR